MTLGRLLFVAGAMLAGPQPPAAPARSAADPVVPWSLRLIEGPTPTVSGGRLVLVLASDGGWAGIDQQMARTLAGGGAVVGLDLKSCLRSRPTPAAFAADMSRVLRHYLAGGAGRRAIVVGHSGGAGVAQLIVNRLPEDLRSRVDLVAMGGGGESLRVHVTPFGPLHSTTSASVLAGRPEFERLRGIRMRCMHGNQERESLCRNAHGGSNLRVTKNGARHFDGDHPGLVTQILAQLFPPE